MNNYSIDASVYAFPFGNKTGDAKEIENYCNTIGDIYLLVMKKGIVKPQHIKYFFFDKDIELIRSEGLLFAISFVNQMKEILKKSNIDYIDVNDIQNMFQLLLVNLDSETPNDISNVTFKNKKERTELGKWQNGVFFEKWFKIIDINFKPNKELSLPDEISEKISNEELIKNTKKNIAKIAYLNEYIYKSSNIHSIILGNCITTQTIPVTNFKFNIEMNYGFSRKIDKYTYKIKNAPLDNICISNQIVDISTLDALVKNDYHYKSGEWEKALNDAKNNFKHLKFGLEVKTSLVQYINKINEEYKRLPESDKQKVDMWKREGPDALYENLKTLNIFVSTANLSQAPKSMNERYHCNDRCEFINACGSNLRFFGVDCVDESWGSKNNLKGLDPFDFVKADRTRKNNEGNYSIFWTHLRPKPVECDNPLWFLALRIHFRLLEPYTAQKIEIGWIGRHLYLPCKKDPTECNRHECPLYPLNPLNQPYDPKAELTNYLKQWPKQEPENKPSKAEKSEKSSK